MRKIIFIFSFIFLIYLINYFFKNEILNIYLKVSAYNNSDLNKNNSELDILKNENEYLKNLVTESAELSTFSQFGILDLIIANSSFLDKTSFLYSDILLNKGYDQGVRESSLVYITGVKPVGVIKKANLSNSSLELFSNYKNSLEVVFGASTSVSINIIGDGSFGFYAKVIDSMNINIGDAVYLKNYPSLRLAEVIDIKDIKNENEKTVYFKSNFDTNTKKVFYIQK